jgi:cellulase/cellobiase CelA1
MLAATVSPGVTMRRISAVAAFLTIAASLLVLTTTSATAATCTGTVQITSFGFNPPAINAGQSSTATLVAQNCTGQPISAVVIWGARYTGPGTGIPPGCPAIDPVGTPLNLAANGQATARLTYLTFASCTATGLSVTANVSGNGGTLASQTATLTIGSAPPPPAACAVTYARQSEWPGGFVAQLTIANTGATAVSGWRLDFTFPGDQAVTNAWSATVSQSGAAVTATNMSYNATIAPGASVSFGFQGTWHASDASPTAFTLNGGPCTVR